MRLRFWLLAAPVMMVAVLAVSGIDWNGYALRMYMSASQPLEVDDAPHRETSGGVDFTLTAITDELDMPWSFAFMPDGDILVTERSGSIQRLDPESGTLTPVIGVPEVYYQGQGGLLDIALLPASQPASPAGSAQPLWVYLTYSAPMGDDGSTTRLARARLQDDALSELEVLYTTEPVQTTKKHYGGRLLFVDNHLYMTMGERGQRDLAQQLDADMGKVLRFNSDGSVPADNPFATTPGARPAIYSYGHRNPQGLARHPVTGDIWLTEHGPQGGDELNRLQPGANYGWPVITYGEEYGGGKIGEGTAKAGMEQPVYYYVPSIATSALSFYQGEPFPEWNGNAFIGALRGLHLNRLSFNPDGTAVEHRMLSDLNLRLRDVKQGPDGNLYLLSEQGALLRLEPALN
jgi:aldose sugar dehydrogenase